MSARLDSGSGFGGLLTDIMPPTEVAFATATDPFVNQLVSGSGTYHAGSFSGTRNFVLRFGTITSNTSGALQNFNTGEADVRFGLESTMSGFLYSAYPGSDGENAAEHGQFITVTATFNESPSEVPEPATLALTGAALIVLARKRLVGSR